MCAKVISAELLTVIRKRLQGKKFTSSIHSKHYLWLTGEFQKYQAEVANVAPRMGGPTAECFQLQGASPSEPLTRGSAPGPRWGGGLCLQTLVIGSRSALAMTRAFCPPHCILPSDAPELSQIIVQMLDEKRKRPFCVFDPHPWGGGLMNVRNCSSYRLTGNLI